MTTMIWLDMILIIVIIRDNFKLGRNYWEFSSFYTTITHKVAKIWAKRLDVLIVYVDMLKKGCSLVKDVHCLIFGDYGA